MLSRLNAFLPQLRAANAALEDDDDGEKDIEKVHEGEGYIEMNLGLGVLEERERGEDSDSDEDGDGEGGDGRDDVLAAILRASRREKRGGEGEEEKGGEREEEGVLEKMLGVERRTAGISVVDESDCEEGKEEKREEKKEEEKA